MLGTLGPTEIIVILLIAVLIFGPRQLPKLGASLGETLREFRKVGKEFTEARDDAEQTARDVTKAVNESLKK